MPSARDERELGAGVVPGRIGAGANRYRRDDLAVRRIHHDHVRVRADEQTMGGDVERHACGVLARRDGPARRDFLGRDVDHVNLGLVLDVDEALAGAVLVLVREPFSSLARFAIPTAVLLVVLVPAAVAAGAAWEAVGTVLGEAIDPLPSLLTVIAFVGLWSVGLVLVAVVCAWRAAVWTVAEVAGKGTFGGSTNRRPGHWRVVRSSATLWPGRSLGRSRRRGEP